MTAISSASLYGFQDAASYDKHRPSYPSDAIDSLLKHLQVRGLKGACILDLAAGTGKFTELLADRIENYEIIAVEPHDDMREELQRKNLQGVKVLKGEAESLGGIGSQCMDAVIASQVGLHDKSCILELCLSWLIDVVSWQSFHW